MQVISKRIVWLGRSNEICWDEASSLMDKLIKGVLSIGARFTPHNGSGRVLNRATTGGHISETYTHLSKLHIQHEHLTLC